MTQPRHSTYRATHNALRHLLFSASHQVGVTDFSDDAVTAETLETIDALIFVLWEHRTREDASIHPPLESRVPGVTAPFAEDHEEDETYSAEMEQLLAQIRSARGGQRVALGILLHERLNAYIGIYLGHLYRGRNGTAAGALGQLYRRRTAGHDPRTRRHDTAGPQPLLVKGDVLQLRSRRYRPDSWRDQGRRAT